MKLRINNLVPQAIDSFTKKNGKIRYKDKVVGHIIEFITTKNRVDAIIEVTDKKYINKLKNNI